MPLSYNWTEDQFDRIIAVSPLDTVTSARVMITNAHSKIHDGNHYTASMYESIGATSTASLLLTTPSAGTAVIHLEGVIETDGPGVFTWSEAPNASGGSAIVAYNNNRTSANTANLTVTYDPTFVSTGTVILTSHLGTYAPAVAVGGQFSARQEWVLAAETIYLIRFTADAASCRTALIVEWYEE